jgi:tRNA-specific 2-thiouridylase
MGNTFISIFYQKIVHIAYQCYNAESQNFVDIMSKKDKVIIGLSGGVDSAVSAYLLKEAGYEVEALFMKNWEQDDYPGFCAAAQDLEDAKGVCEKLNIPLHTVNFSKEYWEHVFQIFLNEYAQGITPNPDVLCNKEIKFKYFLEHAMNLGADWIATGHYARRVEKEDGTALCQAKDMNKDQTYFLHGINKNALNKTLFPLGSYLKSEVREIAKQLDLPNHAKKDSTGICFIGEKKFRDFLKDFLLAKPGNIITTDGRIIGKHQGIIFYTLGQRQGLGLGGVKGADEKPWFVVDKNTITNELMVAQGEHHPKLYAQGLICGPIHWLKDIDDHNFPLSCQAKIRYRQSSQHCLLSAKQDNEHIIHFSDPQRAVTPGQYIVFYDNHRCLGGAQIIKAIP